MGKRKQRLDDELKSLRLPEVILPKFSLSADRGSCGTILSISRAGLGYEGQSLLLNDVSLSLSAKERIAISGKNASGKSTLLKAIAGGSDILTTGNWYLPELERVGYLDQHYTNLRLDKSVMEHLSCVRPDWSIIEIRKHLNDFLFRKNDEVNTLASNLSGGEKARLTLAIIAANVPQLLILDEITNNLDLETKEHVAQVLHSYPGAMIIVSHEEAFLKSIGIDQTYRVENGTIYTI